MAKEKTYYNIRVVKSNSKGNAIKKVEDGNFDDDNELCDAVLTAEELIKMLLLEMESNSVT